MKRRIAGILEPHMTVVEFGSGQSTLWLGGRVGRLLAIEDDPAWYARVKDSIERLGLRNVTLELRDAARYADMDGIGDGSVDFCVIDGLVRGRCASAILPKMKPGGWIYLDNSDKEMTETDDGANMRAAEAVLRRSAVPAEPEEFTGFTISSINTH